MKEHLKVKKFFNYVWSAITFNATSKDKFFAYDTPMFSINNEDSDEDGDERASGKVNSSTVIELSLYSRKRFMSP